MKIFTYTTIFSLMFLLSCEIFQNSDENQHADIPEEFRQDLEGLLENYVELKDALVLSDTEKASGTAESMLFKLNNINLNSVTPHHADLWNSLHGPMAQYCERMIDQDNLEELRKNFKNISELMIEMMSEFRPVDYDVYLQSCPMFGNEPADWLSMDEEIRNPYHGEEMMNCGENFGNMNHEGHNHSNSHGNRGHHGGGH